MLYTIDLPEGFVKAICAFPCTKTSNVFVNLQRDDPGKPVRTFRMGEKDSYDDPGEHQMPHELGFPKGVHATKMVHSQRDVVWAIDNK